MYPFKEKTEKKVKGFPELGRKGKIYREKKLAGLVMEHLNKVKKLNKNTRHRTVHFSIVRVYYYYK